MECIAQDIADMIMEESQKVANKDAKEQLVEFAENMQKVADLKKKVKAPQKTKIEEEAEDVSGLMEILGIEGGVEDKFEVGTVLEAQFKILEVLTQKGAKEALKEIGKYLQWIKASDREVTKERRERAKYKTYDHKTGEAYTADKLDKNKKKYEDRIEGDEERYLLLQLVEELGELGVELAEGVEKDKINTLLELQKRALKTVRFGKDTVIKDDSSPYNGKTNMDVLIAQLEDTAYKGKVLTNSNTADIVELVKSVSEDAQKTKIEDFDVKLNEKLVKILQELYPGIRLEYTTEQIKYAEGLMNQEIENAVKFSLKVVEALNDWSITKPSKHGGESQPVLKTVRLKQEAGIRKRLAGKDVSKEQIDFVFEYMRQNDIGEIDTKQLAERVLLGLATGVEVSTTKEPNGSSGNFDDARANLEYLQESDESIPAEWFEDEYKKINEEEAVKNAQPLENTSYYDNLTVPGGTNYREKEISTPSVVAPEKGHADFATDNGIGWYRVDDAKDGSLRVLEMQSDMFQKMKGRDLSVEENNGMVLNKATGKYEDAPDTVNLNKSFLQILNTDNKWVKFFIQSIVQDATKKGYKKIKFPAGETAAKVEGHESIAQRIKAVDEKIEHAKKGIGHNYTVTDAASQFRQDSRFNDEYNNEQKLKASEAKGRYAIADVSEHGIRFVDTNNYSTKKEAEAAIEDLNKAEVAKLTAEKHSLKADGIEKLAPIEGFYQVRVRNTLVKAYGKDKVKTVKDEHGNEWFELDLDTKRDTSTIMLQTTGGQIIGQADLDAKTVLIHSLYQKQDTLPHEYAHHYIAWFRDTAIVQEGIKKWGSEEALVQAIGEQVVKQKGEAFGWWEKFTKWLTDKFKSYYDGLDKLEKEQLQKMLTDAFLTRTNLKKLERGFSAVSNNPQTYTLRSGGAIGADTVWGDIAENMGVAVKHYYHGERSPENAPKGNSEITKADYEGGRYKVAAAAKLNWGYQYNTMKDSRLVRNWSQVKYADAIFAVAPMAHKGEAILSGNRLAKYEGAVKGGTGYAVGMAIIEKKPVYVFDDGQTNQWYTYNYNTNKMEPATDVKLTPNFAGIGTRKITKAGKDAINDIYAKTFTSAKEGVKEQDSTINPNETIPTTHC